MYKVIRREKILKPSTSDLTAGLIAIQGNYLYHLACSGMIFFVTYQDIDFVCNHPTSKDLKDKHLYDKMDINQNTVLISILHLICFIFLLVSHIVESFSID